MIDEACFPYKAKIDHCPYKVRGPKRTREHGNLLTDGCTPVLPQRTSRYKVGPPSRLIKEHDIMFDIMQSGPVQGWFCFFLIYLSFERDRISIHWDCKLNTTKNIL